MQYSDGQEVRLGDRVRVDGDPTGVVVCCIETRQYSAEFPGAEWEYLQRGCLIRSAKHGLVHFDKSDEDLQLIERSANG